MLNKCCKLSFETGWSLSILAPRFASPFKPDPGSKKSGTGAPNLSIIVLPLYWFIIWHQMVKDRQKQARNPCASDRPSFMVCCYKDFLLSWAFDSCRNWASESQVSPASHGSFGVNHCALKLLNAFKQCHAMSIDTPNVQLFGLWIAGNKLHGLSCWVLRT